PQDERVAARDELTEAFAHHARRGQRVRHARADPAGVPERRAPTDDSALEDEDVGAAAPQLPRAGEADHAGADDDDPHSGRVIPARLPWPAAGAAPPRGCGSSSGARP